MNSPRTNGAYSEQIRKTESKLHRLVELQVLLYLLSDN